MARVELTVQKAIAAKINKMGGQARIRAQTAYTVVGDPDVYGCWRGKHFEFEVKEEGEEPTPIQERQGRAWMKAGAIHAVVYSVEEAVRILMRVL